MKTCPFHLVLIGLCLPLFLYCQQPSGIVEIHGKLIEQINDQRHGVSGVSIYVYENGTLQSRLETEQDGRFSFKLALRKSELKLEIHPKDYRIVIPHQGLLDMPANSTPRMEIEILVAGLDTPPELDKKLNELTRQVDQLESKNQLSRRQINALARTMADTIMYYENQKLSFENSIKSLEVQLSNEQQSNKQLRDSLLQAQLRLQRLTLQVDDLTKKLFNALEEQYLRQKKYFDDISAELSNYLISLKDLTEILPQVKQYFSNSNYAQNYNSTVNRYSAAFIKINDHHRSHLEGVQRYWKTPEIVRELSRVYSFLLNDLHQREFKPAMNEVTNFLQNRNLNKAQKVSSEISEKLGPMTTKLENDTQRIITLLADNL